MKRPSIALGVIVAVGISVIGAPYTARQATQKTTAEGAPRTDHAVGLYHAGLRRVVLIGGAGDPGPDSQDHVWSWSGTRWELLLDAGPPSRTNAAAAYSARRKKAIVAGGSRKHATGWEVVGDSWMGDGDRWDRLADIPARDHHALVANGRGGILMFGGIPSNRSTAWPTDTWELQDEQWKRVSLEGPDGRGRSAMAYDTKRRQIVLFGGVIAPGADQQQVFMNDTWVWDHDRWTRLAVEGPRGRYAHGMVFDERAGVVLLYGGAAAHRGALLSDMWQWDGTRWTEIQLTGPTPGHRYQPVMVYDAAGGKTVLYGGIGGPGDTWEWDGQRWGNSASASPKP